MFKNMYLHMFLYTHTYILVYSFIFSLPNKKSFKMLGRNEFYCLYWTVHKYHFIILET